MEKPAQNRSRGIPLLIIPLVLVNSAAIWGQAGWAFTHVTEPGWEFAFRLPLALLFAGAIESIGIYLAWEAHEAKMADQPSGLLRYASFSVGILAGWLNWDHFHGTRGIVFALLSASSPFLWAVWSTARNRRRQAALGDQDPRGVKLGTARKFWHPVKSLGVTRWAAWAGVTHPLDAVRGWELAQAPAPAPELPEVPVSAGNPGQLAPDVILAEALRIKAENPGMSWKAVGEKLGVSDRYLRTLRTNASRTAGSAEDTPRPPN